MRLRVRSSFGLMGKVAIASLSAILVAISGGLACAQLEITEIMFDPTDEGSWEWIEVRNLGATDVDLNGAWADRLGDNALDTGTFSPNVQNTVAENTIIPAGGVAILYDAFVGSAANFVDQPFRDAWGLSASVPLVGVSFFPALTNGGTSIGLWANAANYTADLIDDPENPGTNIVGSFNNALFGVDYRTGFPAGNNASSIQWNGTGSNSNGANWSLSQNGVNGAVTSLPSSLTSSPINNANDLGNPGLTSGSAPSNSLLISEILYNPASPDADWEWVEVFNNTGATIDFAATNYVFDDNDNADLTAANITSGAIPNGTAAILYNGDALTPQQVQDAWDPGGSNGVNFIPVAELTAFTNGGAENGDTLALWDDFADYTGETTTGPGRSTDNAAVSVTYENAVNGWPDDNGISSIYLLNLGLDPSDGSNWALAAGGDLAGSFNATEVIDTLAVHDGGDVGSPGTFGIAAISPVDLDGDGDVDGADFLAIQRTNPALIAQWQAEFGNGSGALSTVSAVPEPSSVMLIGLAVALLPLARRQRA